MGWLLDRYLHYEEVLLELIRKSSFLEIYTRDPISSRITLFLLTMGTFAFINEVYITLEMTFIQKETYAELRLRKLDEALKQHRLLVDDAYHGREYVDDKSGIVIEEFESKEKFFAKPVHVAHVYVNCRVVCSNSEAAAAPVGLLKFHIEFSPEEYEKEKRPEFGATLSVLRRRLYNLFKDTETYKRLGKETKKPFTISKGVKIYNSTGEELPGSLDDIQLCFVRIETGDTINCEFHL